MHNSLVTFLGLIPKYNEPLSMSPNQRITRKNPDSSFPPGFLDTILRRKKNMFGWISSSFLLQMLGKNDKYSSPKWWFNGVLPVQKIEHTPSLGKNCITWHPKDLLPGVSFYYIYLCFSFREGLDTWSTKCLNFRDTHFHWKKHQPQGEMNDTSNGTNTKTLSGSGHHISPSNFPSFWRDFL